MILIIYWAYILFDVVPVPLHDSGRSLNCTQAYWYQQLVYVRHHSLKSGWETGYSKYIVSSNKVKILHCQITYLRCGVSGSVYSDSEHLQLY